jgi:urease accessory protein UreF
MFFLSGYVIGQEDAMVRRRHKDSDQRGSGIERKLNRLLVGQIRIMKALRLSIEMEISQMFDVNRLVEASRRNRDATNAITEAFKQLTAAAREAQDDPEQLEAVLTEIEDNSSRLASAIVAGTPAEQPGSAAGSQGGVKTPGSGGGSQGGEQPT